MPAKKAIDPLSFCRWKKNENVFMKPIMKDKPAKNISYRVERCVISVVIPSTLMTEDVVPSTHISNG